MEDGVDWHGAICITAIALGCFMGGVGLFSLISIVAGERAEQSYAVLGAARPLQGAGDGMLLVHAGALIVFGILALRARARYSEHLRVVFRLGIPLVLLGEAWSLSEQWALRGLVSSSVASGHHLTGLFIGFGALWSLAWSALKIGLFAWAARYLSRDHVPGATGEAE